MSDLDQLIIGASPLPAIGIADGKIVGFVEGPAREVIDASGLIVLPGVIDAHVHFNEPGRADWEGIATGSSACAVGGTTTFFDMPLNSTPPLCDAEAFDAKRLVAEASSHVDFAFWGGLIPGNTDKIEALNDRGVIGLKAFMSHSGIDDFPKADARTLKAGMERAAPLGLVVAVHAEIDHPELCHGTSISEYLASRPIAIELEAIRIALDLAGETGCPLHIVHVSSAAGVDLISAAAATGVNVSCETCPHYLTLTDEDMLRLGPVAKCAPPLRPESERLELLQRVRSGVVTTVGSDHSPSPMSMKSDPDFFKVWGGISGCQHLLLLLHELGLGPAQIARLTGSGPADRFSIPKGRIAEGADADLVLLDPRGGAEATADSLHYRHKHTPYMGRRFPGRVVRTILRGTTISLDGRVCGSPRGRLIPRTHETQPFATRKKLAH